MALMKNPRVLIAGGVLLVAVFIAIVALPSGGGSEAGSDKPRRAVQATLTLEQFKRPDTGMTELLISLPETRLNTPVTTGGATSVLLRCFDDNGAMVIRLPTAWPLLEEPGYPFPHIHHSAGQRLLNSLRRCRMTGGGINFEGRVPGSLPLAGQ